MSTTDRARLISRLQELYNAFLAYAQTLPDYYDADSDEPTLWADIRRPTRLFIQLDDDILCSANSDVSDWSIRKLAMYAKQLEVAAIGLGIIPPNAAEIQWEEPQIDSETNLHFILGGGYKVEQFMSGGKIYYRAQFHDRPWDLGYLGQHDSFKDGQAACQSHKQRRLNELL